MERSLTAPLDKLSLEDLEYEKERLIKTYIGELDKGVWYYVRLGDILSKIIEKKYPELI
jgi:hypothetical protein